MNKMTMSDDAYNEFINFLNENNVSERTMRVHFVGMSCHGAAFNISVGEAKEDDILATVNDLTFVMEPSLIDNFGGFMFLSSEEIEGQGLALKPLLTPIIEEDGCDGSCCSSCGGGCH